MVEMTEVRIRHESDTRAAVLGQVPLTDQALNETLRLVKSWGLSLDGDDAAEMYGQFVLDDSGAYFEIVIEAREL